MNNLTGRQLVEQGIITGNIPTENIAQHGVDLNLIKVERMHGEGFIPKEGKTILVEYENIYPQPFYVLPKYEHRTAPLAEAATQTAETKQVMAWNLIPGAYSVTFEQGCNIPADKMLLIRQRSSLLRNGTVLHSSVFDAGFKTNQIGTVIIVTHPIRIEVGARIAQIYAHNSNAVENLYNGQFQGDIQRKS